MRLSMHGPQMNVFSAVSHLHVVHVPKHPKSRAFFLQLFWGLRRPGATQNMSVELGTPKNKHLDNHFGSCFGRHFTTMTT